mgnify:CR=1 FL=1
MEELKKYGKVIISTEKKYIDQLHKNIKHYDKIYYTIPFCDGCRFYCGFRRERSGQDGGRETRVRLCFYTILEARPSTPRDRRAKCVEDAVVP